MSGEKKGVEHDKQFEEGLLTDTKNTARVRPASYWGLLLDEKGYLLIESLLGLVLLGVIAISLITTLPILLDASARLDKEQAIYHRLFEMHDQEVQGSLTITDPYEFTMFRRGEQWCAIYVWRDGSEREVCL